MTSPRHRQNDCDEDFPVMTQHYMIRGNTLKEISNG
jgi:hypothetical protein